MADGHRGLVRAGSFAVAELQAEHAVTDHGDTHVDGQAVPVHG